MHSGSSERPGDDAGAPGASPDHCGHASLPEDETRRAKRQRLSREATNAERRQRTRARPGVVLVGGEERPAGAALVYVEGGLRRVRPYVFEHNTFAKARWVGRPLADVLVREFRDRPPTYYRAAVSLGLIRVNGAPAPSPDVLVAEGDMLSHAIHRHEPPVAAHPAPLVLHRDDAAGLLVVSKPASVPVHPTGRYRYNTLVEMLLAADATLPRTLSLVNRLDRLTSGVCVLTTRPEVAREMQQRMESRAYFRKEYVARVRGVFPPTASCALPLRTVEHKLALVVPWRAGDAVAKDASTSFVRLWTDGAAESLVLCRPTTGRMHQIRVHLLCLGHPIANDVLYGTPAAAEAVRIALASSTAADGVLTSGEGVSSSAEGASSSAEGVSSSREGAVSTTEGVVSTSENVPSITEGVDTTSEGAIVTSESLVTTGDVCTTGNVCTTGDASLLKGEGSSRGEQKVYTLNTQGYAEDLAARDALLEALCERLLSDERAREAAPAGDTSVHTPEGSACAGDVNAAVVAACPDCTRPLRDPRADELCIYLHAWRYSTPSDSFAAPLPSWASEAADHPLLQTN